MSDAADKEGLGQSLFALVFGLARLAGLLGLPILACAGCVGLLAGQTWLAGLLYASVPLLAVFSLANLLTRYVFIPLGWPRVALRFTRLVTPLSALGESRAAALFVAIQAIRRRRTRDLADVAWLRAQLPSTPQPVRSGWDLVVQAELRELAGDRDRARPLYEATYRLHGPHLKGHGTARKHATWWLLADAAERGDWDAVVALAPRDTRDTGALETFPEAIAQILGRESAVDGTLLGTWIGEGMHAGTWPWVSRAMWSRGRPRPPTPVRTGDVLVDALHLHRFVRTLPRTELRAPNLQALGAAWEAVRHNEGVGDKVRARVTALEARTDVDAVRTRLLAAAEADLVELVDACVVPAPATPPAVLKGAMDVVWARRAATVAGMVGELARRQAAEAALPDHEEWGAWGALVAAWESALLVASRERRRHLYDDHNSKLCNAGVWLFNARGERFLSHAMFAFLLAEAEAVGASEEDLALFRKNVKVTG